MDTDRLIRTLVADSGRPTAPMGRTWAVAIPAAVVVAAAVFFVAIGPRPDIAVAAETLRFLFKFVVTVTLAVTALAVLGRLARPGSRLALALLLAAPALLLASVAVELSVLPAADMRASWIGSNATICLTFIPLIGIGPLAAFLVALRHAAPTRPVLAGAVAGLASAGLAATFYAAHCTDDSPLFVATWYPLAAMILTTLGAASGRLLLRW